MAVRERTTKGGAKRFDAILRGDDGRQYVRTFAKRPDAEKFEQAERVARDQGTWIDPRAGATKFEEWAEEWLVNDTSKRPRTVARDAEIIERHLLPTFGRRGMATIKPTHVQRFVAGLSESYKPNTVRRIYAVLHAICAAAEASDVIGKTPCRGVKLPAPTIGKMPKVSADQLAALADDVGPRYEAVIWTAALLGLRWGELAALRVGKVDMLRGDVRIDEAVVDVPGRGLVYGPPKSTAGTRVLSAPRALLDVLAEHLAACGLTAAKGDALVFTMENGGPLHYSNFRTRIFAPAVAAVGLDGLTFHGLRKVAATALVLEGVDVKTAMTRMGHSDPRLTLNVYAQFADEADRLAADKVGVRLFAGRKPTGAREAR